MHELHKNCIKKVVFEDNNFLFFDFVFSPSLVKIIEGFFCGLLLWLCKSQLKQKRLQKKPPDKIAFFELLGKCREKSK